MTRAGKPRLALKVDVDTLRGTRIGVPQLARTFRQWRAQATFLFSVGPDHTGRALGRIFRPGFLSKVSRTSVVRHYGLRTLLYGTLIPGPHIGRTCVRELRAVRADGFEVGLHAHDHVAWQDHVATRSGAWAEREMTRGIETFCELFGEPPKVHGAAGWQMSDCAFELESRLGFDYGSDARGTHPFRPVVHGVALSCPQLPTTLPTLDELIGIDGAGPEEVVEHLLRLTRDPPPQGHVFTLHAELEGMGFLPVLVSLLEGWTAQGYELVSTRRLCEALDLACLPLHRPVAAALAGRAGTVTMQGPADAPRPR